MDTVESARERMLELVRPLDSEPVSLESASGRTLAEAVFATRDQPPFRSAAMDGYAVRSAELGTGRFTVVGEAAAGSAHQGTVGPAQAVRIFTGAPVPPGLDMVIPQERTQRDGTAVIVDETAQPGKNIRAAAIDFAAGSELIAAGTRLHPRHIALIAAAGIGSVTVSRRPRVALLATGSEIAAPGRPARPYQIYDSVTFGLGAMIESWGGLALRRSAVRDEAAALSSALGDAAGNSDLVVVVGGASVGDYDIVKQVLATRGLEVCVPKIAVRPGKPTWFGAMGHKPILGLPGNPAAAFVCAALFLRPLLCALAGGGRFIRCASALLDGRVEKCGENETYWRARVTVREDARLIARPFDKQDTSLVSIFAASNALIRRLAHAEPAETGALVEVLLLDLDYS